MNGFRACWDRKVTEVEGFDGSGLMIEDVLQDIGDDIGDLETLNLRLRSKVADTLRPATAAFAGRRHDASPRLHEGLQRGAIHGGADQGTGGRGGLRSLHDDIAHLQQRDAAIGAMSGVWPISLRGS